MSDYKHHEAIAALRSRITERTLQAENAALRSRISELIVNLDNLPTERTLRAENAALRSRISVLEEALREIEGSHRTWGSAGADIRGQHCLDLERIARAALAKDTPHYSTGPSEQQARDREEMRGPMYKDIG